MNANLAVIARAVRGFQDHSQLIASQRCGFSDGARSKVVQSARNPEYVPDRLAAAFGSEQAITLVGN
jgi:LacI family transcriptional regulator, gluconate utilization system Gnt-I transcriptional repressor